MQSWMIRLAESGYVPDPLVRAGIRGLLRKRLADERSRSRGREPNRRIAELLAREPIAVETERANEQHYELPAEFFRQMLGPRMKYSSGYWTTPASSLEDAEETMLSLTCERAGIADGMRVLDLGCGWGSLSLWIAERYPRCLVTSLSNSSSQADCILARAAECGLRNLTVRTASVDRFEPARRFDRIVSVEMFEHMRNYRALLARLAGWLEPDGKLFVHMFCHRRLAYLFRDEGDDDWMARNFFTGGTMPSLDLLDHFDGDLRVAERWTVDGTHYERTLLAWLHNLDERRDAVMKVLREHYGPAAAQRWFVRWRLFLLGCAELFSYRDGTEWLVGHYRLERAE